MSLVTINWRPDPKELRKFGVAMIIGFALIGGLIYWRGHIQIAYAAWAFGAIAGLLGLTGTPIALPIYWLWMGVAFVMGNIVSRVLLALTYYLVVTPIGLAAKLAGRDKLQLRSTNTDTYYHKLPPPPSPDRYPRQF